MTEQVGMRRFAIGLIRVLPTNQQCRSSSSAMKAGVKGQITIGEGEDGGIGQSLLNRP